MREVAVIRDERQGLWFEGRGRRIFHPSRYLRGWVGSRYVLAPLPGSPDHAALTAAQEVLR